MIVETAAEESGSGSFHDADALVSDAFSPEASPEAPSEGNISGTDAQAAPAEPGEESPTGDGRSLRYKGEDISMDDDRFRNFAQKGFDYEKKMHQQKVDRRLFDQERESFNEKYGELKEINEYAKSNPQFNELIQREWQKIQSGQADPLDPQTQMAVLQNQVRMLQEQATSQTDINERRRVAEMEVGQETSIGKYKDDHSGFDWATKDEEGQTLEDRISHAMLDNGVSNFKIMADSFLMKEHMSRNTMASKENAGKEIQKANKLGLGKLTKTSQLGVKPSEDVGNKSYDNLAAEALAELGLG